MLLKLGRTKDHLHQNPSLQGEVRLTDYHYNPFQSKYFLFIFVL